MRIAVTISSLPQLSTNQLVGLSVAEELERRGHTVDLYCLGTVSHEQLLARFQKSLNGKILGRRWLWAPGTTIYDYPIMAVMLSLRRGYDLAFEAIGPVIHLSPRATPQLTYIFFPPDPDLMGGARFGSLYWRLYSAPYRLFYKTFSKNVRSTRIISISSYVADLCKKAWGMESEVVYFPVPYASWEPKSNPERTGLVTIGRFSPEKNQLEQIRIAARLQDAGVSPRVRIIGSVASVLNHKLYIRLRSEVETRGITNVEFHANAPQSKAIALTQSSKVFLHTTRNEHFGIATVEAIAAGCIPIVHDSGGSKEIVPDVELRYRSEEEAVSKIRLALSGEYDRYLPGLRRHIERFSERSFKERVTEILLAEVGPKRLG